MLVHTSTDSGDSNSVVFELSSSCSEVKDLGLKARRRIPAQMKMSLLQKNLAVAGVTAVEPEVVTEEEAVVAGVTAVEPEVVTGEEAVVAGETAVEPEVVTGEEAPEVVAREGGSWQG